jgi:predicted ATPase
MRETYARLGYELIQVPQASVTERAKFVLASIA